MPKILTDSQRAEMAHKYFESIRMIGERELKKLAGTGLEGPITAILGIVDEYLWLTSHEENDCEYCFMGHHRKREGKLRIKDGTRVGFYCDECWNGIEAKINRS